MSLVHRTADSHDAARALLEVVMLVMRSVAAEMRRSENPLEPPQMGTLMKLASGPCTMSDLARHLNVTPPTVSRSVDMLVRRGWVERTMAAADRRRTLVGLTPEGRKVLREMKHHTEKHVAQALRSMSGTRRAALVSALRAVREALS